MAGSIPGRDYVGFAERLVDAGAEVESRMLEVAERPLYGWLDAQLRPRSP